MSNDRFAPAEAAFRAGDRAEGIRLTAEQLTLDPNVAPRIYQNFTAVLIRGKLYDQAEHWARVATEHHPRDLELWNILGVALRRLGRHAEGLKALDRAIKINPKNLTPQINRGNILNDLKNPAAIEVFVERHLVAAARGLVVDGASGYRDAQHLFQAESLGTELVVGVRPQAAA